MAFNDKNSSKAKEKILVVDDVSTNLNLLASILEAEGFEILAAPSGKIALDIAHNVEVDMILLDILMPEMDGMTACRLLKQRLGNDVPIIFISAKDELDSLTDAFSAGAVDYITKPIKPQEVVARVNNHINIARLRRELAARNTELTAKNAELLSQIEKRKVAEVALEMADERLSFISAKETERWGLSGFIGKSRNIGKILDDIRRLQNHSQTNVMVLGESGSGKELVARAIHFGGGLAGGPFIPVNCSAIPAELAEAEFFGNIKGAYTGATGNRRGYFELADGGTLFLDEIGDLSYPLQAKLLRTLEDGRFYPVGGGNERHARVRVIAATNADLPLKMEEGEFRRDLYFRLAQYVIEVPPLRERKEDIPLLVSHFLASIAQEMKIDKPAISDAAMQQLTGYPYPGNIRELKNIIERAIIVSGGRDLDVPQLSMGNGFMRTSGTDTAGSSFAAADLNIAELNMEEVKKRLIETALERTGGNISAAAKLLGVHRSWIYRQKN